jgi:hypothetical protein
MTRSPAGEKKRAAGVVWVRRLDLASRGLTGLLNPCVKSDTKLFQPYFINCFNCASPVVPVWQPKIAAEAEAQQRVAYVG